ncbi:MAG TPA: polynucleotide adenylyltransferase PcnB [Gammaproteobacteria bacterium]|nr:polynucleotide adenylyltransferase PcnB [Gammaproteobacteria bacterium]
MFSWLKPSVLFNRRSAATDPEPPVPAGPRIVPRGEHGVSRANISENALKVLYRLTKADHEAYLVGGGVRDLLLGHEPKDFDVATSATPEEVKELFRNSRLIGRRFRLAHVFFGGNKEIIEVATFRAGHDDGDGEGEMENGMIVRDNVYGTLEDDAWRRDFTVNALYYDIRDFSVVDHTGGVEDLRAGRLRIIGDPYKRFREDPVRMLRAVRFAAKLGFRIDSESEAAIYELGHLLQEVVPARLFDEILKLFMAGYGVETFELLRHYRLFGYLFPETDERLAHEEGGFPLTFIARALENTDNRVGEGKPVTPAFLFAALMWEPLRHEAARLRSEGANPLQAIQDAAGEVVARQNRHVAFPKRFSLQSREIWELQERFTRRNGKRPYRLLDHPRFRAGYDFLVLRAGCEEGLEELAAWWGKFQDASNEERRTMTAATPGSGGKKRPRRRRRGGNRKKQDNPEG